MELNIKCVWLPFGFEFDSNHFNKIQLIEEKVKLCFIGTPDKERSKLLIQLAQNGFEIDIFSLTYPFENQLKKEPSITLYPVVSGISFWENVRKYRVQLNFLRDHNKGSHNQRTFEVPGVGGVLLTEYSEEQSNFFEENQEIFMFKDFEGLIKNAQRLLNVSKNDTTDVRHRCREKSVADGYTYESRTNTVINELIKI